LNGSGLVIALNSGCHLVGHVLDDNVGALACGISGNSRVIDTHVACKVLLSTGFGTVADAAGTALVDVLSTGLGLAAVSAPLSTDRLLDFGRY
jgi:hypothetical protein